MSTATETVERSEGRQGLTSMIRRVKIRNYKSIENCDVELGPFTILVGRNGAGKSNFLDALRFVTDALTTSLASAVDDHGGMVFLRRVAATHVEAFTIEASMGLPSGRTAEYGIDVGNSIGSGPFVLRERLRVYDGAAENVAEYLVMHGKLEIAPAGFLMPPASAERLYLGQAAGFPEFGEVLDSLTQMRFYTLNPEVMRPFRPRGSPILRSDGSNITSAFAKVAERPDVLDRLVSYLRLIAPQMAHIRPKLAGGVDMIHFDVEIKGAEHPASFHPSSMSDGTLRALGILVAINQLASDGQPIRLVGIEEPETALHPAAVGILMNAFREAATHTQILVTTHSADLLDEFDPDEDHLLAVESRDGRTEIGPVNRASREAIREHLYSAGELLRMDYIEPERPDVTPLGQTSSGRGGQP